jgi:cell division protein ZapB
MQALCLYSAAMDVLDLLEQRVSALLAKADALSADNALLKQKQVQELSALADENTVLRDELEKERVRNNTALRRIEALVERIKEQTEQA